MASILTKRRVITVLVLSATVLLLLLVGSPFRAYETTRLLLGLANLTSSVAKAETGPLTRKTVAYQIGQQRRLGDVYHPIGRALGGIVLLHGAAPLGKDNPRLVAFAATLARARFIVLVPDILGLRELQLRADNTRYVVDAVSYMKASLELTSEQNIGIVALSVASAPAFMAALKPEIQHDVRFILAVGGYYDLSTTLMFATTGYYHDGHAWQYREPNDYAKWVFVLSNVEKLGNRTDREILSQVAERMLKKQGAAAAELISQLTPKGHAVYQFINNTDVDNANALFAQLPSEVRAEIQALSLNSYELAHLSARVILVHGFDDSIIPYTESVALARALPAAQTKLFLINGLVHVELDQNIIDYWRLWRAVHALLIERDRQWPHSN
jgi:pimeloyl-ACP methyl ester carboxylesterase